ncbi:MAG: hypothetical protein BWY82_02387 [Verrucomicrobia bacterium ADurb.Bin474]|nr:MAG: hypothetical protein BWY82_02387 [Verrucomicrobia bacterium ADurb.Bin474]
MVDRCIDQVLESGLIAGIILEMCSCVSSEFNAGEIGVEKGGWVGI